MVLVELQKSLWIWYQWNKRLWVGFGELRERIDEDEYTSRIVWIYVKYD